MLNEENSEVEMSFETVPSDTDSPNKVYTLNTSSEPTRYSYIPDLAIDPADDMPER